MSRRRRKANNKKPVSEEQLEQRINKEIDRMGRILEIQSAAKDTAKAVKKTREAQEREDKLAKQQGRKARKIEPVEVGSSKGTIKAYKIAMKQVMKSTGVDKLHKLDNEKLNSWLEDQTRRFNDGDVAAGGRTNKAISALKQLNLAIQKGYNNGHFKDFEVENIKKWDTYQLREKRKDEKVRQVKSAGRRSSFDYDDIEEFEKAIDSHQPKNVHEKNAKTLAIIESATLFRGSQTIGLRPENIVIVRDGKVIDFTHLSPNSNRENTQIVKDYVASLKKKKNLEDGYHAVGIGKGAKENHKATEKSDELKLQKLLDDYFSDPRNQKKDGTYKDNTFIDRVNTQGKLMSNEYILKRINESLKVITENKFKNKHASEYDTKFGKQLSNTVSKDISTHDIRRVYGRRNALQRFKDIKDGKISMQDVIKEKYYDKKAQEVLSNIKNKVNRRQKTRFGELDKNYVQKYFSQMNKNDLLHNVTMTGSAKQFVKENVKARPRKEDWIETKDGLVPVKDLVNFVFQELSLDLNHYREDVTTIYFTKDEFTDALKKQGLI